jgi:hypothetical protein
MDILITLSSNLTSGLSDCTRPNAWAAAFISLMGKKVENKMTT